MPRVKQELPALEPKGKTVAELVKELKAAVAKKKKFEEEAERYGSLVHKIAVLKLPPLMENAELDYMNVPGVAGVELVTEVYPSIKKEDIEAWYKWLRENKHGDIIVPYIHPKTQQAFVKEQLIAGKTFPAYVNIAKVPTAKLKAVKK